MTTMRDNIRPRDYAFFTRVIRWTNRIISRIVIFYTISS